MDLTIPSPILYVASWFGIMSGLWALFDRAETVASPSLLASVRTWIRDLRLPVEQNWARTFANVFDGVFGKRHVSIRCLLMSTLTSVVLVALMTLLWASLHPTTANGFFSQGVFAWLGVLFVAVSLNVPVDYLSLLETRLLLRFIGSRRSIVLHSCVLLGDLLLTGVIFLLGFGAYDALLGTVDFWELVVSGIAFDTPGDGDLSLGIFLYTTYFTSVWLWLFLLSTGVANAVGLGDRTITFLKSALNVEEKPIRSLGFLSMLFVTLVYLLIPLGRLVWT